MASVFEFLMALTPGVFLVSLLLLVAYAVKGQVTMIYDGSYQAAAHYATLGGLVLLVLLALTGFAAGAVAGAIGGLLIAAIVVYGVALVMSRARRGTLADSVSGQVTLVALEVVGFALLVAVVASRTGQGA
jgi:hypothetical protein